MTIAALSLVRVGRACCWPRSCSRCLRVVRCSIGRLGRRRRRAEASLVRADDYMIVAAHPLAAEAGRDVLAAGGSAVDAAIAAQMVLTLVEPQSSGIGGGGFLLHYNAKTRKLVAYDGRETAPASARPGMFLDASGKPRGFDDAVVGGLSVGVPGAGSHAGAGA